MFKKILRLTLCVCFLLMFVCPVYAASLEFKPITGTSSVNGLFSLELVLNVDAGEQVWGYETKITFPENLVTYRSADFAAGPVFLSNGETAQTVGSNYVVIGGYFNDSSDSTTTGGVVGTLKFNALTAGDAVFLMVCDASTNIYAPGTSQTNIFTNCADIAPRSTINISSTTLAPTATNAPITTQTVGTTSGQITQLPETGDFQGEILLIGGLIFILFGGFVTLGFSRIASR